MLPSGWVDGLLLWCVDQIGSARYRKLIGHYGTAREVLGAGPGECARALGQPRLERAFSKSWPTQRSKEWLVDHLASTERHALHIGQQGVFPEQLRQANGPQWIFVRGNPTPLSQPFAAVVGSRTTRPDGIRLTRLATHWLKDRGWNTISGGAIGVDSEAHRASLDLGLTTVAVMPGGLDHLVPRSSAQLFKRIVESGGCLVSEHPPWREPRRELFVRRNRIISGMSVFTVVVRAPLRSGALSTARWAMKQGRQVFVIPGSPDDPTAQGCLAALKTGAKILTEAADLPRSGLQFSETVAIPPDTGLPPNEAPDDSKNTEEQVVLKALGAAPRRLDELIVRACCPRNRVVTVLMRLVAKGSVAQIGADLFEAQGVPLQRGGPGWEF